MGSASVGRIVFRTRRPVRAHRTFRASTCCVDCSFGFRCGCSRGCSSVAGRFVCGRSCSAFCGGSSSCATPSSCSTRNSFYLNVVDGVVDAFDSIDPCSLRSWSPQYREQPRDHGAVSVLPGGLSADPYRTFSVTGPAAWPWNPFDDVVRADLSVGLGLENEAGHVHRSRDERTFLGCLISASGGRFAAGLHLRGT